MNQRLTLDIDPSVAIVGYAIIMAQGNNLQLLVCNVITTRAGVALSLRLRTIYQQLSELVERYRPHEVVVEELFFERNTSTAIAVGQARGVALLAVANAGLSIAEIYPERG